MRIVKLVNDRGGVESILGRPLQLIPRKDLAHLFDVNDPAFADYLDYLEHFGAATGFEMLYEPTPYSEFAEYCYPEEMGIYNPPFSGTYLGVIYGEGSNCDDKDFTISNNLKILRERIPKGFLPIANDIFGCMYLLTIKENKKGYIYFWDNDNDPDTDEYFEMHGEVMPKEVEMQNMYCVGKNFYDFVERMTISPDNDE